MATCTGLLGWRKMDSDDLEGINNVAAIMICSLWRSLRCQRVFCFWGTIVYFVGCGTMNLIIFVVTLSQNAINVWQDAPQLHFTLSPLDTAISVCASVTYLLKTRQWLIHIPYLYSSKAFKDLLNKNICVSSTNKTKWNLTDEFGIHWYISKTKRN